MDSDWYDSCSKWLWIKCKDYVKLTLSKDNLERNALSNLYSRGNCLFLHRFIKGLSNSNKGYVSDHINGKSLDNRSSNLRVVTILENNLNRNKTKVNKSSKYKGVSHRENNNKPWVAATFTPEGSFTSKAFYTEEEAGMFYDQLQRFLYYYFLQRKDPKLYHYLKILNRYLQIYYLFYKNQRAFPY